jgi:GR25 family glycosyltransferase involved in LPS biosynthesis
MEKINIKKKNLKFDTIIIISLKKSIERRKNAISESKKIGISNIIILDAVDGIKENIDPHIACTLSHIKAWNYVKSNNIKNYIIVEDDVFFLSKNKWDLITKNLLLDPNWDIILFGYFGLCEYNKNYSLTEKILYKLPYVGKELYRNKNNQKINKNIFIPESPLGLHCYTINNKSINKILNLFQNPFNLPDVMLNMYSNKINIYAVHPCLAYQNINKFGSYLSQKSIMERFLNNFSTGYVPIGWRLSCYGKKIYNIPINGFTYVYLIIIIIIIIIICYHKKQIW